VNAENIKINLFREKIRQLQRNAGWQMKSDASCCGVTVAQCHALLEIEKHGEVSLVELAGTLGLDNSTLSRTIESMVQEGLVERCANPHDRRYISIMLAERGKTICDNINQTFYRYYKGVLELIPAEKQQQVIESVNLLAEALQKYNQQECSRQNCCQEDNP
jgi:DNA-binding MarR family transcriptional regulator